MSRVLRVAAVVLLPILVSGVALGQGAGSAPAFQLADVEASPQGKYPLIDGGALRGGQYVVRLATMVDLVASAYGVKAEDVQGGPWVEWDRFNIVAESPAATSPEMVRQMLQTLLADRFKLVARAETTDRPAFLLSVGKDKPKLKAAEGTGEGGCEQPKQRSAYRTLSCHGVTMGAFAQMLHEMGGSYLPNPVVDSTGLKGSWDFEIHWTDRSQLPSAGADGITLFDALDKQLGLKLEAKTAALPSFVIVSVNKKPTANLPGVAEKLMPLPPEFEVAVIRPSAPGSMWRGLVHGGQVDAQGVPLGVLIALAWETRGDSFVSAPGWLNQDRWDILAKPSVAVAGQTGPPLDNNNVLPMMRKLLADRFKVKVHMEDRPGDGYVLIAGNPKLKKADPTARTRCQRTPGPGAVDPRIANPRLSRLMYCQNVTIDQFAEYLRNYDQQYIQFPILDATGLEGTYDMMLSYSYVERGVSAPATSGDAAGTSEPDGSISLADALREQLGLKLEMRKRPMPALVIDHVEQKPTEN